MLDTISNHLTMDPAGYVARRMMWDICEILSPINLRYEPIYEALFNWMEVYTRRYGGSIIYRLPSLKTNENELLFDMATLYAEILSRIEDINSMISLNTLFTVSFYMMVRYKETPRLCSKISYYFELISYRLSSWNILENRYESGI